MSSVFFKDHKDRERSSIEIGFRGWKFAWALNIIQSGPVQISMEWDYLPYDHPLKLKNRVQTSSMAPFLITGYTPAEEFSKDQINSAKDIYEKLAQLDDDVIDYLKTPVKRWIASRAGFNPVDRFIDFGIALESFYLHEVEQRNELLFKLSLRAAQHLGKSLDNKKELIKKFKKAYSLRCDAVHKGKLDSDPKKSGAAAKALKEAQNLFGNSLIMVIDSNKIPKWG